MSWPWLTATRALTCSLFEHVGSHLPPRALASNRRTVAPAPLRERAERRVELVAHPRGHRRARVAPRQAVELLDQGWTAMSICLRGSPRRRAILRMESVSGRNTFHNFCLTGLHRPPHDVAGDCCPASRRRATSSTIPCRSSRSSGRILLHLTLRQDLPLDRPEERLVLDYPQVLADAACADTEAAGDLVDAVALIVEVR